MELKPPECQTTLLEYDRRFEIYGDGFVFYDYNKPLELPKALQIEPFDLVIADPPFLSEECLRKMAQTIKFLAKGKILLCTGTQRLIDKDIKFLIMRVGSFQRKITNVLEPRTNLSIPVGRGVENSLCKNCYSVISFPLTIAHIMKTI